MSKKVFWLLVALVMLNAYFNSTVQLHYDEAYYWVWGHNIALSYFDHPPMIAYMMYLCSFLGKSEFVVRLPAVITSTITIVVMFNLARKMFNSRVANMTVLLAIAWPMLQGDFFIVTPDCPLNMFWALTLWSFYIGVFENKTYQIYLAGIWAGCCLLSKYTGVLILPSLFVFLLCSTNHRRILLKKDIYLSFILALVIFSPVIIWNYQHHWSSFLFQLNHGFDGIKQIRLSSMGDYIAGQIGVSGPFIALAILYYVIKYPLVNLRDDKLSFLFLQCFCTLIFFLYSSLYAYVGANWTTPALISGIILLAHWLVKSNNKWVCRNSLILTTIAWLMVKLPTIVIPTQLSLAIPQISSFFGNYELTTQVKTLLKPNTIVIACDYGNASRTWYYLNTPIYVLDKFKYAHSYQDWNNNLPSKITDALFICDTITNTDMEILKEYFTTISPLAHYTFNNRIAHNQIYVLKVKN